jgi:hypothetical protein
MRRARRSVVTVTGVFVTVTGVFVTCGASRQGLAGVDLNRKWRAPQKNLHPTIFYMKARLHVPLTLFRSILLYFAFKHPPTLPRTSGRAEAALTPSGAGFRGLGGAGDDGEDARRAVPPRPAPRAARAPRPSG